jgi:presenilin-like A22 family membrane protease
MAEWVTSEGVRLHHPNRQHASAKAAKAIVALLLVVSAALMIIVAAGGWTTLQGAKPLLIAYIILYFVFAFYVMRWVRGVLPLSAACAILLLIFAAIAGPEWFARDKAGFKEPAIDESILGVITLLIVPVQVLLIGFAMHAFQQAWNVEEEVPGSSREDYGGPEHRTPLPA